MDLHAPFMLALFGISIVSQFASAATGFGGGIIFHTAWKILGVLGIGSGRIDEAVMNIVAMELLTSMMQAVYLRKHLNRRLCLFFIPPIVLATAVGTEGLADFDFGPWLKRVLGLIFLLTGLLRANGMGWSCRRTVAVEVCKAEEAEALPPPKKRTMDAPGEPTGWVAVAVVAFNLVTGLMRGLVGIAGPVHMVMLLYLGIEDHRAWRSMSALNRVAMSLVQITLLGVVHGKVSGGEGGVLGNLEVYIVLTVGGTLGLSCGNLAAPHIDKWLFDRLILGFLLVASLLMMSTGFWLLEHVLAFALLGCGILLALGGAIVLGLRRARGKAGCRELSISSTSAQGQQGPSESSTEAQLPSSAAPAPVAAQEASAVEPHSEAVAEPAPESEAEGVRQRSPEKHMIITIEA